MNERQTKLLENLRVDAHLARATGIRASCFYAKVIALKQGKNPVFTSRTENPAPFEPAYKADQIEFYDDLIAIATEKRKELEVKNGN